MTAGVAAYRLDRRLMGLAAARDATYSRSADDMTFSGSARAEYDRLRAIIHNAARTGPAGQNRASVADFRAHLLGRIAWIEQLNPVRGRTLRRAFALIDWA